MTTIKPGVKLGVRTAVARRTEELFRSSGALPRGHFLLKSGRHGDAYVEKFAVLSDPAATSELCCFWAAPRGAADDGDRASTSSRARRRAASSSPSRRAASSASGRSSPRRSRTPTARPGASSGAGSGSSRASASSCRRHPDDRRLAAGDAPGGRGDGRRDRRVRRPGRPERRGTTTLTSPATGRVYPLRSLWQLDLPTYEPGPATCPRCADGTPLHAPGSTGTGHA